MSGVQDFVRALFRQELRKHQETITYVSNLTDGHVAEPGRVTG